MGAIRACPRFAAGLLSPVFAQDQWFRFVGSTLDWLAFRPATGETPMLRIFFGGGFLWEALPCRTKWQIRIPPLLHIQDSGTAAHAAVHFSAAFGA